MTQFIGLLNIGTDFQKFPNAFFNIFSKEPEECFLLMFMIREFNKYNFLNKLDDDARFFLSYPRIQKDCFHENVSKPTIIKMINGLIKKKFIKKEVCKNNREANYYSLNFKYINSLIPKPQKIKKEEYIWEEDVINISNNNKPTKIIETDFAPVVEFDIKGTWNDLARHYNLARLNDLSDERKRNFKNRLKQMKMTEIEYFAKIKEALDNSRFLRGESKDWKATFDFFVKKSSAIKAFEGVYNDNKNVNIFNPNTFTKSELASLREEEYLNQKIREEQENEQKLIDKAN